MSKLMKISDVNDSELFHSKQGIKNSSSSSLEFY